MGYTYVMSDIHAMAELFWKMLDKIQFSDRDTLYILGDMIDRGPDPAGVIDTVRAHGNITALLGNHEDAFASWYDSIRNGGIYGYFYNTYDILNANPLTRNKIGEYAEWMKGLPWYKKVTVKGQCYVLVHASAEGMLTMRNRKDTCIWDGSFVERQRGIPGFISIVGHVPTFILRGYPQEEAYIWRSPNGRIIDIDCGAVFTEYGGRLACLGLETGEEFYVSGNDEGAI